MDGYEWDVFISYRRFDKWKSFLDRHFLGLLAAALQPELRKSDVRIFVDRKNIKEGSSWPDALQNACSRSQVVVPLICAGYWDSSWCKHELAVFLEREAIVGFRRPANLGGLIVPVVIHDGELIPDAVAAIQSFKLMKYAKTYLASKSGLEKLVEKMAVRIAECHRSCPPFDASWAGLTGGSYLTQLEPKEVANDGFPRFA